MPFPQSDSDPDLPSGGNYLGSSSSAGGSEQLPVSMTMTEFHFLLLYKDRLVAMSRLTGHVVQEQFLTGRHATGEMLSSRAIDSGRLPLSLLRDPTGKLWMITTSSAYQVRPKE